MIPDEEFIKDDRVPGPTKEEIRCLVLCKADPMGDEIVADVGCGTGGFTLEFAKKVHRVYAIDRDPQAIKITRENLINHGLGENVKLINEDAEKALKRLGDLDIIIIGGSGGRLSKIIEVGASKLTSHGRIIVTSILLETKLEAVQTFKRLGFKPGIIDVNIARGHPIKRGTMMLANNPISIIWGGLNEDKLEG
ncbi:MAG TPA: precorrin-6Y C5,15-methyltransferase (decarboxylating) subunit CbiT [Methanothermobacter sp.]|jgi:cobalt-precorrin-6B (C15)-methyltransferase|uniref:Probable cobalt-precorrin-6B C(15)-methyltransferase (decarboxylating) n=1 Tax=Methanothermobacter tenebrarum TaxID=680118 RepID=A0ABM7YCX9_9EURY|nr:precorrin-6Y C5,15-methyltransferase (decarboxylating) subunit CbiT [Methanothermobacter tenebrarum]MDI6881685.1 precorrin-6Y C5,15-methyltransferase (decarboxylating) subunit CbiT [Methanothermobacter sp.]MDX9693103.1 precorrin-6Y C5,15-methyltransferase (decarboxylating) subunit CbiT [Methanothermobacter sp.]BDH79342.1 SAM-dependent methyltransferase [Methanothermobacter tenebrarum]HHW16135.1 precorrin-6Y C5,15-methyltransferase (decarboxylating) subunit CbiT [Methanothermobacter sp.]HOQ1